MHSVPKSAVLPYASGVGGLSRRLLNNYIDDEGQDLTARELIRLRGQVVEPAGGRHDEVDPFVHRLHLAAGQLTGGRRLV